MKKLLLVPILLILGCNSNKKENEAWSKSMVEMTMKIQDIQEALEDYNKGIEKYDMEDYEGAIEYFDKALIKNPDFTNAYFSRGTAKMLAFKDYLGAVEDFTEVIKLSPNKEFAYYERGFAKFLLLNYEGAIEDFSKAIEINNDYALAYEYRGYVYEKLEDFESAAEDFFYAYMATDSDNPMSEVYLRASIKIKKELSEN